MKADTAERLTDMALQMSHDLSEMVRDIQVNEPDKESTRLRRAIGRVMWTIYYEILMPTVEEHPALERASGAAASPARIAGPSARRLAPPSPGSRRPRRPRGSRR